MSDDDLSRFAEDDGHPVAREGLRSLRDEHAPESSVKATLEALRRAESPARRSAAIVTFLVWALVGAAVAAVAAYFLFFG